jgi:IclR family acetate operon transcriptional repressor
MATTRRLPVPVPLMQTETLASYLARLATANHLDPRDLRAHLGMTTRTRPPDLDRLAAMTGHGPHRLADVLADARPPPGRSRLAPLTGRIACRRCTARRGIAGDVYCVDPDQRVCHRHRRWLGGPTEDADQHCLDFCAVVEAAAGAWKSDSAAGVQSVDRALSILEILARRGETGVTELAGELGVHKSTAFRLVAALEARNLVEQVSDRGRYRLGFGLVRLAGATTAGLDVVRQSRPVCEQLALELEETVNVAVADGEHCINLSQVRGPSAIASHNWIGQRTPLHATSSGKVLLAHQPGDRLVALLTRPMEAFTANTITDPDRLKKQLEDVRHRGFGFTLEEYEVGLNAVAAPLRGMGGTVVAAVSVSGPSYRLTQERMEQVADRMVAAAAEISARLGYWQ